jgi:hypothetical protein
MRPLVSNGRPTTGDRDGDTVADANGYDTPDPGDTPGICGNGLDDDQGDTDGDTVPDGPLDGVADDGCQMPLTPVETCINIIDDGVKNADEDAVVAGQDRAMIDVTVGLAVALSGIPGSRPMSAWQYSLNWDVDVLDIRLQAELVLDPCCGWRLAVHERGGKAAGRRKSVHGRCVGCGARGDRAGGALARDG